MARRIVTNVFTRTMTSRGSRLIGRTRWKLRPGMIVTSGHGMGDDPDGNNSSPT